MRSTLKLAYSLPDRVAAILLEIDANELTNAFTSQDFFIFKIGKIGNSLGEPIADRGPTARPSACCLFKSNHRTAAATV